MERKLNTIFHPYKYVCMYVHADKCIKVTHSQTQTIDIKYTHTYIHVYATHRVQQLTKNIHMYVFMGKKHKKVFSEKATCQAVVGMKRQQQSLSQ